MGGLLRGRPWRGAGSVVEGEELVVVVFFLVVEVLVVFLIVIVEEVVFVFVEILEWIVVIIVMVVTTGARAGDGIGDGDAAAARVLLSASRPGRAFERIALVVGKVDELITEEAQDHGACPRAQDRLAA
jgi:hypothetical protein